jgi:hypothetical protein
MMVHMGWRAAVFDMRDGLSQSQTPVVLYQADRLVR